MNSLLSLLLPTGVLIYCLNVALASVVVCAMAIMLSRRASWSLPVRHALPVAALAIGMVVPVVIPFVRLPTNWSIRVSQPALPAPAVSEAPLAMPQQHAVDATAGPAPVISNKTIVEPEALQQPTSTSSVASVAHPASPVTSSAALQLPWPALIGSALCGMWLVGMGIGLGRGILGLLRLQRWQQTVAPAQSPAVIAVGRLAAQAVGLNGDITVCHSALVPAPVTWGLLRPRVVIPTGLESKLSPEQLRAVIQHEMAHIARRDLWIGLLQHAAQTLYWWNPLVFVANRQVAGLREQICDDIAIREMPEPNRYAATLLDIAEQCSQCVPVPATLGIVSPDSSQLESRIRRIISSTKATCFGLNRRTAAGVVAATLLMTATILFAQVQIEPPATAQTKPAPEKPADKPIAPVTKTTAQATATNPSLAQLLDRIAAIETSYMPYQMRAMETIRMADGLSLKEKTEYPWADGRKHQRLMEYAQLETGIWRKKETHLVDGVVEQSSESFGERSRTVGVSSSSGSINGVTKLEYYIRTKKRPFDQFVYATPLEGLLALRTYSKDQFFSDYYRKNPADIELRWDGQDARLNCTITFPDQPQHKPKFVLWLSREHNWHPVRLHRFMRGEDKQAFSEWQVTKFAERDKNWRVAEGSVSYREFKNLGKPDNKIVHWTDFNVLEDKYGSDVAKDQFKVQIPEGATVRTDEKKKVELPPVKTREITVRTVDLADQPIPQATVRLRGQLDIREYDIVTADERGVARSAKSPADNMLLEGKADGYRPCTLILGAGTNEVNLKFVPISKGTTVDRDDKPIRDVWITNQFLFYRPDGLIILPSNYARDKEADDWSDTNGQFEMKTDLTIRRPETPVPFIAVDPSLEKMAIAVVSATALNEPRKLVLQSVVQVKGKCLLEGVKEVISIHPAVETPEGARIGQLQVKSTTTPEGLQLEFQVRLPPGQYALKHGRTSQHGEIDIPIDVPTDRKELDLGTIKVKLSGTAALTGKPAPELNVQWRADQQLSWDKLRGKVVVIDFWGTWCTPCLGDMVPLMQIYDQFHDKPVQWLSVHTAGIKSFEELDKQTAKLKDEHWNKRQLPFTTVIDQPSKDADGQGKTCDSYGIVGWPTLIVIDQEGNVVGAVKKEKLAETITRLLEGAKK